MFGDPVLNGRWPPEGDAFVAGNRAALAQRPVWLFSVATFGDRKRLLGRVMRREPKNIDDVRDAIRPRGYRVLAGVIERGRWPAAARLLFHVMGGRFGDNRDWADIDARARTITRQLRLDSGSATER